MTNQFTELETIDDEELMSASGGGFFHIGRETEKIHIEWGD